MNKRSVIIDTGPGIDDALAIAIALSSDELDVRLISTVTDNVGLDKVTYNALRLSKRFRRENVSVAVDANRPLIHEFEDTNSVHGKSGMEGFNFEELAQQPLKKNIVDAIRNAITSSSGPIILVLVTPLTNIALLLRTYPEMKRSIHEIVLMGGSASRGDKGIIAEFNIVLDPEATRMVFYSSVELIMVGLGVGLKALVLSRDSEKIRTTNKTGEMAYYLFKKCRGGSFRTGLKMYDVTAAAYLLKPELFEAVEAYLDVELYGTMTTDCTLIDLKDYLRKESNAIVYLDTDGNTFRIWFRGVVAKCG